MSRKSKAYIFSSLSFHQGHCWWTVSKIKTINILAWCNQRGYIPFIISLYTKVEGCWAKPRNKSKAKSLNRK